MISGLTNLIFGNCDSSGEVDTRQLSNISTPDLQELHVDDDWILFADGCRTDDCVSCELCRYQEKKRLSKSSDSSQTSITPSVTPMEGSWLVTPPPCFMSRSQCLDSGDTQVVDPLENLLIEHPSMSVYSVNPQNRTVSPCTSVGLQRRLTRQHHNQVFGYEIELRPQWLKTKRLACRESHLLNRGNKAMMRHNKATNRHQECKPLQAYKRKL